ncbi:MAG: MerR family transcriptional regulator [Caulobacteraceae bacterium]
MTKGPEAFRTISEAADELGVPQHVLRFWETKFSFIRPMKRAGGRRFYRPQDLTVLRGVRALLHEDGYTLKGVQRLHKEQGIRRLLAAAEGAEGSGRLAEGAVFDEGMIDQAAEAALEAGPLDADSERRLREALEALEAAKARLTRALSDG